MGNIRPSVCVTTKHHFEAGGKLALTVVSDHVWTAASMLGMCFCLPRRLSLLYLRAETILKCFEVRDKKEETDMGTTEVHL